MNHPELAVNKCLYYNDARTACNLMIDDFVPVAVTPEGIITPANDWGYAMDAENSLFRYFQTNLLDKFPEIRGTFFIPLESHRNLDEKAGYTIYKKDFDSGFKRFFKETATAFDLAFHGIRHTYADPDPDSNRLLFEFNHLELSDIPMLKEKIKTFEELMDCKLQGGKFPGYRGNEFAFDIVEKLDFLWWSSIKSFLNSGESACQPVYFGQENKVLDIPQTFHGNAFNKILIGQKSWKNRIRYFKHQKHRSRSEKFLRHLYENRLIITVQEHFQNQRTDGRRQSVNVYDDINSLDYIFSYLRGADIWYARMNELAQYIDSYRNCEIEYPASNQLKISYMGRWEEPLLSLAVNRQELTATETGVKIQGVYKNGSWIFNNLAPGTWSSE